MASEQLRAFSELEWANKTFVSEPRNAGGHAWGAVDALAAMWPLAARYDVVVHQHPDVFWTNETFLDEALAALAAPAGAALAATTAFNFGPPHYAFDVFAFAPAAMKENIFADAAARLGATAFPPEQFLHGAAALRHRPVGAAPRRHARPVARARPRQGARRVRIEPAGETFSGPAGCDAAS